DLERGLGADLRHAAGEPHFAHPPTPNGARSPLKGIQLTRTSSTRAIRGPARSASRNRSSEDASPSASTFTAPSYRLRTSPSRPSRRARDWAKYRNPTPWTSPKISALRRRRCGLVGNQAWANGPVVTTTETRL